MGKVTCLDLDARNEREGNSGAKRPKRMHHLGMCKGVDRNPSVISFLPLKIHMRVVEYYLHLCGVKFLSSPIFCEAVL
ncbi:hypothetical protein VTN77DRAFT_3169 [Rasamsonia byssochlamydoides]|uniref:uncharacterized protein n=1 Tax=Rasamsonia byssochlamydoides TaxID=89139 RepID=UPI00374499A3